MKKRSQPSPFAPAEIAIWSICFLLPCWLGSGSTVEFRLIVTLVVLACGALAWYVVAPPNGNPIRGDSARPVDDIEPGSLGIVRWRGTPLLARNEGLVLLPKGERCVIIDVVGELHLVADRICSRDKRHGVDVPAISNNFGVLREPRGNPQYLPPTHDEDR